MVKTDSLIEPRYSSASVTGFTCGLLSVILCACILLALPLALVGLHAGKKGWQESRSLLARRGYHLSLIGLILSLVIYAVVVVMILLAGGF